MSVRRVLHPSIYQVKMWGFATYFSLWRTSIKVLHFHFPTFFQFIVMFFSTVRTGFCYGSSHSLCAFFQNVTSIC